jgi:site-specific DNA recombinase
MRAIGYVRASTGGQGITLEAQAEKIRQLAQLREMDLLDVIVDGGQSGKDTDRPGLQRLLALADGRCVDVIVIAKLDRLARSVSDLNTLVQRFRKRGVALVSVAESLDTESASGRLLINLLASVAQFEREVIAERTATALQWKRSLGEKVGGKVPYGFDTIDRGVRPNGTPIRALVPNDGEQEVLRVMREMKASGMSYQQIADALNTSEVRTKDGKCWRKQYIHRALNAKQEASCPTA